jgi:tetratricopeptide (TPR) repeat protein
MLLGRSLALCVCLVSLSAIAHAETGKETGGKAKLEIGAGFKTDSEKTEVKADAKVEPKKADAKVTEGVTKDASGVRRDPKGKKGISPYWEAIRRGDEAALARDFAKAEEAYQAAIGTDPKNPVGHFRRGQILVRSGKLADAEVVYQDAMRLADKDTTIHAAALFVLADLKERQGQRDAAITAWKAYADYLKAEATAKGYPETAIERDKRMKKYNELVVDGKAIKERIQLRLKEVDEAKKRQAAKNPNEGK